MRWEKINLLISDGKCFSLLKGPETDMCLDVGEIMCVSGTEKGRHWLAGDEAE